MNFKQRKCNAKDCGETIDKKVVPDSNDEMERQCVEKERREPLEDVDLRLETERVKVSGERRQVLLEERRVHVEHFVESRKAWRIQAGQLKVFHQTNHRPERVLFAHVNQQKTSHKAHALSVSSVIIIKTISCISFDLIFFEKLILKNKIKTTKIKKQKQKKIPLRILSKPT